MFSWPTLPWDGVVHFQDMERESTVALAAPAFLLGEQDVLVLTLQYRRRFSSPGDVGVGRDEPLVEQVAHGLL